MVMEGGHKPGEFSFVGSGGKVAEGCAIGRSVDERDQALNGWDFEELFNQEGVEERKQGVSVFSAAVFVESAVESGSNKAREVNILRDQLEKPCDIGFGEVGKVDEVVEHAGLKRIRHRYFLRFGVIWRNKIIPKAEKKYNL